MNLFLVKTIAVSLIIFCLYQMWRYRDFFHPISFQFFLVGLMLGARSLWVLAGHSGMMEDPEGITLLPALVFYLGFFALAICVYRAVPLVRPSFHRLSFEIRPILHSREPLLISAALYAAFSCVALVVILKLVGGVGGFYENAEASREIFAGRWWLLYGIFSMTIASLILYALTFIRKRGIIFNVAVVASFLAALAVNLLSGFRGWVIQAVVHFLVLRNLSYKKMNMLVFLFYGGFAVVMMPIMTGLIYGKLAQQIRTGNFSSLGQGDEKENSFATRIEVMYGRFYTLEGTVRVLDSLRDGEVQPEQGRLLWVFPKILLPSFLVGDKPSITQIMGEVFFGDRYKSGKTSCVTSLPAFMFWQIGWVGFVFAAVFYGTFLRFWVTIYETTGLANSLFVAITYPYFSMVFVGHVGTFAELIYLWILLMPLVKLKINPVTDIRPFGAQLPLNV